MKYFTMIFALVAMLFVSSVDAQNDPRQYDRYGRPFYNHPAHPVAPVYPRHPHHSGNVRYGGSIYVTRGYPVYPYPPVYPVYYPVPVYPPVYPVYPYYRGNSYGGSISVYDGNVGGTFYFEKNNP